MSKHQLCFNCHKDFAGSDSNIGKNLCLDCYVEIHEDCISRITDLEGEVTLWKTRVDEAGEYIADYEEIEAKNKGLQARIAELEASNSALGAENSRLETGFGIYSREYESAVATLQHYQEFGEEGELLGNILERIIKQRNEFQAEVSALGAIVDKLPKDADGKHFGPGDTMFLKGGSSGMVMSIELPLCKRRKNHTKIYVRLNNTGTVQLPANQLYSTKKAAEKAKDKQ